MSSQINTVLFDLDGVLADSRKQHYFALNRALNDIGIDLTFEEHSQNLDGLPTFIKIQLLANKHKFTQKQIDYLNKQKQKYTKLFLEEAITPNPEHRLILDFLKNKKIKMGICSNTKRSTLEYILKKLKVSEDFEVTLANEDVKDPKPSAEIYEKAFILLETRPELTLIIEDSPHGILAARSSGAHVCVVHSPSELTLDLIKKNI